MKRWSDQPFITVLILVHLCVRDKIRLDYVLLEFYDDVTLLVLMYTKMWVHIYFNIFQFELR